MSDEIIKLSRTEITYLVTAIDRQITECQHWIKHFYGTIKVEQTRALDIKSHELNNQLEIYYHLRRKKDILLEDWS